MQWEEVPEIDQNGVIIYFEIRVDPAQFQDVTYVNVSGSELVLVVGGLEESADYSFSIRAYTIAGPGPFSDVTTSTTDPASESNIKDVHGGMKYLLNPCGLRLPAPS